MLPVFQIVYLDTNLSRQVTTQYHLHTDDFSQDCVRSCTVQRLDNYGGISESVDRQSCYLMRVDEMYAEVGKHQIVNI